MTSIDRRMRILVVAPSVPYPPNWGFGIRVFNLLVALQQTCDVTLVCYAGTSDRHKLCQLREYVADVVPVDRPEGLLGSKRIRQILSVVWYRSYQSLAMRSKALREAVSRVLDERDFDIAQLESSQLAWLAGCGPATFVLDEHNIEFELLQRMTVVESVWWRKAYNWIEYRKFRREEMRAWRDVTGCVLTSDRERVEVVRHVDPSRVHVAPNGVDVAHFGYSSATPDDDLIVYCGLMTYRPNIDAVTYFVGHVLPEILRRRPGARFLIVGLGANEAVGHLAGGAVEVASDVPDVRPYLRRASVVVVPLRMGSGTRLKVVEGLAMGRAMVSTSVGCEGIAVEDGVHLLIADSAEDFATAVVELLGDPERRRRLGECARQLAVEHYGWASISAELLRFYDTLLGATPTSAPSSPRR